MKPEIGSKDSLTRTITENDTVKFSDLCGDSNPIHTNKDDAIRFGFKKQIVQGFFVGSLISAVIGTRMPGNGTIYLEQNLKFVLPVYVGDTCTAEVIVSEVINEEKGIYRLDTKVHNQNDEIVINGYAVVKYLDP